MAHEINYPLGGVNKMWEPMHILVDLGFASAITIKGRTWTRDGAEIAIFDSDDQEVGRLSYSYHQDMNYHFRFAEYAAQIMNILFELRGEDLLINPEQLFDVMNTLRQKCESRYGNYLPDTDHEVLVSFATK